MSIARVSMDHTVGYSKSLEVYLYINRLAMARGRRAVVTCIALALLVIDQCDALLYSRRNLYYCTRRVVFRRSTTEGLEEEHPTRIINAAQ